MGPSFWLAESLQLFRRLGIQRNWVPSLFGKFFLNPVPHIFCRSSAYLRYFWLYFCITTLTRGSSGNLPSSCLVSWRWGYLSDIHRRTRCPSRTLMSPISQVLQHSGSVIAIGMGDSRKDRIFLTHRFRRQFLCDACDNITLVRRIGTVAVERKAPGNC